MIEFMKGNIFSMLGKVQALVNPVNCVGTAGKGLALEFKRRWPEAYVAYRERCLAGHISPGTLFTWREGQRVPLDLRIIHFPTKRHWRDDSRLEDIEMGLFELRSLLRVQQISSVAIPALGCGNGKLDWRNVRAAMHSVLIHCTEDIYIFAPEGL